MFVWKDRKMTSTYISGILLLMIAVETSTTITAGRSHEVGVCYGLLGNNLPPPTEVVALSKRYRITKLRLYDPNHAALEALKGSDIEVALGVRNEDIQNLASNQSAADSWFDVNMKPYTNTVRFSYVVVGNEVIPGVYANYVAGAMQNLLRVIRSHGLKSVKVTTAVSAGAVQNSYPPSATEFGPDARGPLTDILKVLSGQGRGAVLMVNLYPYFAYAGEPQHISLQYAQFTATKPVVRDGNLAYYNLFTAMVDAFYWAMEKAGGSNVGITVSESGWPSSGNGNFTSPDLALTYNKNFIRHIVKKIGTPKKPHVYIEAFIFAMFNENLKPSGVEQHWGLFYPDKKPVYPLFSSH